MRKVGIHSRISEEVERRAAVLGTVGFIVALGLLPAAAGYLLGGWVGAVVAVVAATAVSFAGARYADRFVLGSVEARPLRRAEAPVVWALAERLSARAGIPMPRLWLVPSAKPNAFTVGRSPRTASIGITLGLLRRLDLRELAGVLAHELAHIRSRDILLSSFATTVTALLSSAGRLFLPVTLLALPLFLVWAPQVLLATALLVIAPVVAILLQAALSRRREFAADASAARLTGDPIGLARALEAIEHAQQPWWAFLFGASRREDPDSPLQSHPATRDRVARLLALAPAPKPREAIPFAGGWPRTRLVSGPRWVIG